MKDVKVIEERILVAIKNHDESRMSFDEIVEKLFDNPETTIATIVHALNNLVERGHLRQFRAIHYGRIQNHYSLVR